MNTVQDFDKNEMDPKALFRIGYGLYLVTARRGDRDNGMIANAVMQVTNDPQRIAVALNKESFTHDMICATGKLNVSCLAIDTPFSVFEHFGMKSGKTVSKFDGFPVQRAANGVLLCTEYANAYFSLEVEQTLDLGTHTMFLCRVVAASVLSDKPTLTYDEYHRSVKPKSPAKQTKGYVCRICGYVYEGDPLPDDFICPICKHGVADFEPIGEK